AAAVAAVRAGERAAAGRRPRRGGPALAGRPRHRPVGRRARHGVAVGRLPAAGLRRGARRARPEHAGGRHARRGGGGAAVLARDAAAAHPRGRHGQRAHLHLLHGGGPHPVRARRVERQPRGGDRRHVAPLLPDRVPLGGVERHRRLVGGRDRAVPRDRRGVGRVHALVPRRRAEAHVSGAGRRGGAVRRAGVHVVLWGYAAVALLPLLVMVWNSFRTDPELVSEPLGLPVSPSFDAYREAWGGASFSTYFLNSVLVTTASVLLSTAVSLLAAYALARSRSRLMTVIEQVFVSGLMMPVFLMIVPIFYLLDTIGLASTRTGLILVYA